MATNDHDVAGRRGQWRPATHQRAGTGTDAGTLVVDVVVLASRKRYSHVDYLIAPRAGHGQRWVNAATVTLDTTEIEP